MKQLSITEVGLRDGLQNEPNFFPTENKIEVAKRLINAGVRKLEATSFVSPKAIPQLADAEAVVNGINRTDGLELRALVPNVRGAERAAQTGIDVWVGFMSVSEKHSQANSNASVNKAFERIEPLPKLAEQTGATVCASLAVAFDCPFEGQTPIDKVLQLAKQFEQIGVSSLMLCDTIGSASPSRVKRLVEAVSTTVPAMDITLHFHNTRGMALANVLAGIQEGVSNFESAIGGIGGCPFAPGATGNVATEDLVHMLEQDGFDTGIDLNTLIDAGKYLSTQLDRKLPAHLQSATPVGKTYEFTDAVKATG